LQLLVAVLQELWPLQELAPMHLPISPACVAIGALASSAAAATAIAAPVVFFAVFMVDLSSFETKHRSALQPALEDRQQSPASFADCKIRLID
jgi:hypothetical protein